jgi:hypothetical protein
VKESPFVSIARKIGDPRLEKTLEELAVNVKNEIHNAKFVSLRTDVRGDVKRLKADARRFEIALNNVSKRILDLPAREIDCLPKARQAMRDVVALCDKTLSTTSAKGGRSKAPGRVTSALIVIEAWVIVHQEAPGANNVDAQEVCDDYWRACGGQPIGKEGDPSNWRRPMIDALSSQGALRRYIRDEFRRTE